MFEKLSENTQWIFSNKEYVNTNEAIISYLDMVETRIFLVSLLILLEQLNKSRKKGDIEFIHRIRTILVSLNFPDVEHLGVDLSGRV